eukprot:snap_masked-scaffold_18-processed-gene-6.20-mRNA-1 protein AED:1.00 eAED:1.00 QI:0/-1/0/0/-1/1/1/0/326
MKTAKYFVMYSTLLVFVNAQENDSNDSDNFLSDISTPILAGIVAALFICLCGVSFCIFSKCSGGSTARKTYDIEDPSPTSPNASSVQGSTLARSFVPSVLKNDKSENEKRRANGVPQSPSQSFGNIALQNNNITQYSNEKENSVLSRVSVDRSQVSESPVANTTLARRKQRGLSYGRLDTRTQERIQSVRLQAEEGGLTPFKVLQQQAPNPMAEEVNHNEQPQSPEPKDKEAIKQRMKRIAERAGGGGIYATGGKTASFGGEIIEGFTRNREKRVQTFKPDAYKAQIGNLQEKKPPVKKEKAKAAPPGKNKLQAFLDDSKEVEGLL